MTNDHQDSEDTLTSEILASLVVDALLRAGVVRQEHVELALEVVTEEIHVRHSLGEFQYL